MKKAFCLLLVLVLALCLTGCASKEQKGSKGLTGEWYEYWVSWKDELTEKRPDSVTDLPEDYQEGLNDAELTFCELDDEKILVIATHTESEETELMLLLKEDGIWNFYYLFNTEGIITTFGQDEGSVYNSFDNTTNPFTFTLSDDKLTLKIFGRTTEGTIERWHDDIYCFEYPSPGDEDWTNMELFIRRNTVIDDGMLGY